MCVSQIKAGQFKVLFLDVMDLFCMSDFFFFFSFLLGQTISVIVEITAIMTQFFKNCRDSWDTMPLESIFCEVDTNSITLILQLSVRVSGSARNKQRQRQKSLPLEHYFHWCILVYFIREIYSLHSAVNLSTVLLVHQIIIIFSLWNTDFRYSLHSLNILNKYFGYIFMPSLGPFYCLSIN